MVSYEELKYLIFVTESIDNEDFPSEFLEKTFIF